MSTKIYYAYKLNINPEDLMPFLLDFKNRMSNDEDLLNLSQVLFAYERVYELLGIKVEKYRKVEKCLKELYKDHIRWGIAIIPRKGYFLAIPYFPTNKWFKEFERDERIEYYGYWNNSDKPEDVSEEEWERRGKEWKCLSYGVPLCKETLIYEPFTSWEFPSIHGIYKGTHHPESLRNMIARDIYNEFTPKDISFHRFKWKIPLITKELLLDNQFFLINKYIKED